MILFKRQKGKESWLLVPYNCSTPIEDAVTGTMNAVHHPILWLWFHLHQQILWKDQQSQCKLQSKAFPLSVSFQAWICCLNGHSLEWWVDRGSLSERSVLTKAFDVEEFRKHAHQMVDFIADYHRDIESFPVRSQVEVLTLIHIRTSQKCS